MEEYDQNPPKITPKDNKELLERSNHQLYIATYNVRTLMSYERLIEMEKALANIKYDIIGISEVRRLGNTIKEYKDFILCSTGQTQGRYGVGFIIRKDLKQYIESYLGISERVALLNLDILGKKFTIIQVYAPTEESDEEEVNIFYDTVYEALGKAYDVFILMGDFNAKIGMPLKDEYLVMKQHGYGTRNIRGQRLVNFAMENKLAIINTFFKKKDKRRWTWQSPNEQYKNEIDFILTNHPHLFQNIETLSINFTSDHRPLRAKISFTKPTISRCKFINKQYSTLKNEEDIKIYTENLKTRILHPEHIEAVQESYDKIIKCITDSLQTPRPSNSKETRNVLTENTERLLKRRQELQKTKNKTRAMKNELKALYKLTSKHIKKDYKRHRIKTIQNYLEQKGSLKKGYKALRTNKIWIEGLKESGETAYNRKDIINIATKFYKTLYSTTNLDIDTNYNQNFKEISPELPQSRPIDCKEVIETIKILKSDKSPGPDNITNNVIKSACWILAAPLTKLFNLILETGDIPSQWSESNIILLYKKGDPKDITNYRPISLLPSMYKLFSTIINQRISAAIENNQPIEQAGFRKNYSTIDHIHTLELIIEKYQEYQRPLYILFIDYQKAFDTILHESIWSTLITQNVDPKIITIIKNLYRNSTSRVKLETTGPSFPVKRGVRQGDPLSPKIFIAVLESIIRKLDWKNRGLYIQGKYLSHLRFADDLVLLSESSSQLQYMLNCLHEASRQVGLEMNITKTKVMTNHIKSKIIVENVSLEYVHQYIYLGKQIGFQKDSNDLEVERRVRQTWNKYWSYKEVFKSEMPVFLKKKVMDSCLIPCLTYACQTWKFTNKIKNKIITCQRGMERSMLGIRKIQKINHTKIRSKTKTIDALSHSLKLKWKWAGHITRLEDRRWSNMVTSWKGPPGKRSRGRPLARWEDDLKKIAGSTWQQIARDREKWKALEEAFT